MKKLFALLMSMTLIPAAVPHAALAQAPGVAIEPKRMLRPSQAVIDALAKLREAKRLMSQDDVVKGLNEPTPMPVRLAPAATTVLTPPEIAKQGRRALLRVAWYCLPKGDDRWRLKVAGGYVVGYDGVCASAYHVLQTTFPAPVREAYLVALDTDGNVYPVTKILAADAQMDVALFKVSDGDALVPLGINDQTRPGDAAYLFSDPTAVQGYFSAGFVNRFYWDGRQTKGDAMKLNDARGLRMEVSTDWAPGSSGAAVLDDRGNAIGHVSKIFPITDTLPSDGPPQELTAPTEASTGGVATYIALHNATPIRCVRLLVEDMNRPAPTTRPGTDAR